MHMYVQLHPYKRTKPLAQAVHIVSLVPAAVSQCQHAVAMHAPEPERPLIPAWCEPSCQQPHNRQMMHTCTCVRICRILRTHKHHTSHLAPVGSVCTPRPSSLPFTKVPSITPPSRSTCLPAPCGMSRQYVPVKCAPSAYSVAPVPCLRPWRNVPAGVSVTDVMISTAHMMRVSMSRWQAASVML